MRHGHDPGWWGPVGYIVLCVAPMVAVAVAPGFGVALGAILAVAIVIVAAFGAGKALR